MAQALRATGTVLLSMGAAAAVPVGLYCLAAGQWARGLVLFAASFAWGCSACALFRAWVRHSPRHGGHDGA